LQRFVVEQLFALAMLSPIGLALQNTFGVSARINRPRQIEGDKKEKCPTSPTSTARRRSIDRQTQSWASTDESTGESM
jgi:hypothetical protein